MKIDANRVQNIKFIPLTANFVGIFWDISESIFEC